MCRARGCLKIYGWRRKATRRKPASRILYVGRTIATFRNREREHRRAFALAGKGLPFVGAPLLSKAVGSDGDKWEMVPIKEYPDITRDHPEYGWIIGVKERWWISRHGTHESKGGLNKRRGEGGDGPNPRLKCKTDEIVRLYVEEGWTLARIGRKYNTGCHPVSNVLKDAGVELPTKVEACRRQGRKNSKKTAALRVPDAERKTKRARKMRKAGETYDDIAAALGVSPPWVRKRCMDIPKPRDRRMIPLEKVAEIRALAEGGMDTMDIVKKMGIGQVSVLKYARDILERNATHDRFGKCGLTGTISKSKIADIRRMRRAGHAIAEIMKELDVSRMTVDKYSKGLDPEASSKMGRRNLEPETIAKVRRLREKEGLSWSAIGERVGKSKATARMIYVADCKKRGVSHTKFST